MLMKPDKKNMASIIVDRYNKKSEEPSPMQLDAPVDANGDVTNTEMDGPAVAADEVFAALESKDKAGFIEAMKSMVSMCMDAAESDEAE